MGPATHRYARHGIPNLDSNRSANGKPNKRGRGTRLDEFIRELHLEASLIGNCSVESSVQRANQYAQTLNQRFALLRSRQDSSLYAGRSRARSWESAPQSPEASNMFTVCDSDYVPLDREGKIPDWFLIASPHGRYGCNPSWTHRLRLEKPGRARQ